VVNVPTTPPGQSSSSEAGKVIFDNWNIGGVSNAPTQHTVFSITQSMVITKITNYHWNSGRGAAPGTIGLRSQSSQMYGPWQTSGSGGQSGSQNINWHVSPNVTIPAGTYTVVDSQPSTWAQNGQSQGRGFSRIEGRGSASASVNTTSSSSSSSTGTGQSMSAELINKGRDNVHIFVEGQDTAGPQNRLTPGQSRTITVKPVSSGRVKFLFMRGGSLLGSCYWQSRDDGVAVIRFTEDGGKPQPVCTTRLR
jgi:hypothetical protein